MCWPSIGRATGSAISPGRQRKRYCASTVPVRRSLGVEPRGGNMVQPWAREKKKTLKSVHVQLAYEFQVQSIPSGGLWLALEGPETFKISVNGAPLCMDVRSGWWVDRSLEKIPLDASRLHLGANEMLLECDYDESHSGFEICYLLGNFGVRLQDRQGILTDPPAALDMGDWVAQGLPFYSGSVSYVKNLNAADYEKELREGHRVFVQVPEYRGACLRVMVNGQVAGLAAWEPNEVDITDYLTNDSVELRIEVLGHRRNSHGPLHHTQLWPNWTGPGEFISKDAAWSDDYQMVPCGLMAEPVLSFRTDNL